MTAQGQGCAACAPVNKIIPFSLVDGPGSRTSVFLQGCNIACAYCHNPETQQPCNSCGACVQGCPTGSLTMAQGRVAWNSQTCVACDACLRACGRRSTPRVRMMGADEVFEQIRRNRGFIRGVTVSGGECMLHPEFLRELFSLCRAEGLTTLIDTNGTIDLAPHESLLAVTSGVMLDVKAWDDATFAHLTRPDSPGVPSLAPVVRRNLELLARRDLIEELRIVVVDGWNDPEECIAGIARTLGPLVAKQRLKLIRFRRFGVVGPLATAPSPVDDRMEALRQRALSQGFREVVLT